MLAQINADRIRYRSAAALPATSAGSADILSAGAGTQSKFPFMAGRVEADRMSALPALESGRIQESAFWTVCNSVR
jgi:hypothetical protein